MKRLIETKKIIVAALILTIALFSFPVSSFGWEGCVIRNEGDILGLEFYFGEEGLPLELPGLPPVHVTYAEVQASGKEKTFITPFDQYIYETKLWEGWEDSDSEDSEKGKIIADTAEGIPLVFFFKSAKLFESFLIMDPEIEVPEACEEGIVPEVPFVVDLLFEVTKAKLVGVPGLKFNIILRINAGIPDEPIVDFL